VTITPLTFDNEPIRQQEDLERRLREDQRGVQNRARRLGDTLLSMGLLTNKQVRQIAAIQEETGEPFGRVAINKGLVKPEDVQAAIGVQFGFLREADHPVHIPNRLVVLRRPYSKQAEEIRLMRTRLVTSCVPEDLKVISIVGIGNDQACVELGTNLGAAFAQLHRKALVLDANLRNPGLRRFFANGAMPRKKQPGLTDYITNRARYDDVIEESIITRLDILSEGQRAYNPQILLSSDGFEGLLARARKDYDVVLLLSSGYGPIADGQFVWQKSDTAIVVARMHKTREDELKQLSAVLYDLNTTVLGAVMAR